MACPLVARAQIQSAAAGSTCRKRTGVSGQWPTFEGMIVYDEASSAKRPVILHGSRLEGASAPTARQARAVAGKGLCGADGADMFGKGYGDSQRQSRGIDGRHEGRPHRLPFTIACGTAASDAPCTPEGRQARSDRRRQAGAIGYCAGADALERRAPVRLQGPRGVLFFYTSTNQIRSCDTSANIKGRVLAIHGRADPVNAEKR